MVAASRIVARNGVERGPTLGKGRVRDRCRRQSRSAWLCRARHQGRRAHRGSARPGGGRGMARHRRDPSQQIAGRLCLAPQRRGRSQSLESHGRAICRRRKPRGLPPANSGRIGRHRRHERPGHRYRRTPGGADHPPLHRQGSRLILSGTLRERAEAPPALRSQLQNLAQYRGRDPQGRIPVDLEFTL